MGLYTLHYSIYISQGKWFIAAGGIGMLVYVGNYVYTRWQIDNAPRRAFVHGHVPAITKDHTTPFISRDEEVSHLCEFIRKAPSAENMWSCLVRYLLLGHNPAFIHFLLSC